MRILMLSYEYPPLGGGGSQVVHGLAHALLAEGCQVDLVTMGFRGLPAYEELDGLRILRTPSPRTRQAICYLPELGAHIPLAARAARRLVSAQRYDINHTHFLFPDGVTAWYLKRSTGLPFVVTAHGSDVPGFNPDRFTAAHRLLHPLWQRVVRSADEIVFPSRALARLAEAAGAEMRSSIIPHGFELGRFGSLDRPRAARQILTVCRLFERKGVQYLLRGVDGLPGGCEVHVVGTGPYLEPLQELAGSLGLAARFHGWIDNRTDEFAELLATSSVFVFTSEVENFPVVLLEAMAAGIAIVTTRGTGCEEVVGDTAVLVPPRDPAAVRNALASLIHDEAMRHRLGEAARRRVREVFSWPAVARQYLEVYERRRRRDGKC